MESLTNDTVEQISEAGSEVPLGEGGEVVVLAVVVLDEESVEGEELIVVNGREVVLLEVEDVTPALDKLLDVSSVCSKAEVGLVFDGSVEAVVLLLIKAVVPFFPVEFPEGVVPLPVVFPPVVLIIPGVDKVEEQALFILKCPPLLY